MGLKSQTTQLFDAGRKSGEKSTGEMYKLQVALLVDPEPDQRGGSLGRADFNSEKLPRGTTKGGRELATKFPGVKRVAQAPGACIADVALASRDPRRRSELGPSSP